MIYRVYSDNCNDLRTQFAVDTWYRDSNIINVNIKNSELPRNDDGLPFLKDILDFGFNLCEEDEDIILYTNTDIGLAANTIEFPKENFFMVRKNVEHIKLYTQEELAKIPYENSINCDAFGVTKQWYSKNKNRIPDFLIGSPAWDLCLLILLEGKRLNNIIFHVEHESLWKKQVKEKDKRHIRNRQLFQDFLKRETKLNTKQKCLNYFVNKCFFKNINNPIFISFYTPSHKELFDIFYKSYQKHIGENFPLIKKLYSEQLCKSAIYHDTGWRKTQVQKFKHILETIQTLHAQNDTERLFVFCDSDIIICNNFIKKIENELTNFDLVVQTSYMKKNGVKYKKECCSGFFAGKPTKIVIDFIEKIYQDLLNNIDDDSKGDQYFMNVNSNMLNIKHLDDTFFSPGHIMPNLTKNVLDFEIIKYNLPKDLSIFHANCVVGTDTKIDILNYFNN